MVGMRVPMVRDEAKVRGREDGLRIRVVLGGRSVDGFGVGGDGGGGGGDGGGSGGDGGVVAWVASGVVTVAEVVGVATGVSDARWVAVVVMCSLQIRWSSRAMCPWPYWMYA